MATFCLSERVNEATEREPKLSAKRMPQCGLKWTPNGQSFRWSLRWREGMLRGKREKERGWTGGELVCVHGGWLKSTKILSYKTLKGENRGECCQTTRQEILVGEIVVSDHNQELFVIKVSTNRGWRRLWMQISLPKKPFSNETKTAYPRFFCSPERSSQKQGVDSCKFLNESLFDKNYSAEELGIWRRMDFVVFLPESNQPKSFLSFQFLWNWVLMRLTSILQWRMQNGRDSFFLFFFWKSFRNPRVFKAVLRPLQPTSRDKTHTTLLPRWYPRQLSRFPN